MLFYDFEQILMRGSVWSPVILQEYSSLSFTNSEGKITCILIIELRTLLEGKSYHITIFHSSF